MSTPAAWHPDPTGKHEHRYWDGERWTEHVSDAGQASTDPLEATADDASTAQAAADDAAEMTADDDGMETSSAITDPTPDDAGAGPVVVPPTQPAAAAAPAQPAVPAQPAAPAQPVASATPVATGGAKAANGAATAAVILGIIGLLLAFIPIIGLIGVALGVIALILGIVGRGKAKKGAAGGGASMTGIVTGILAVIIGIMMSALPFLFLRGVSGEFGSFIECIEATGDEEACAEIFERGIIGRLSN